MRIAKVIIKGVVYFESGEIFNEKYIGRRTNIVVIVNNVLLGLFVSIRLFE